MLFYIYLQISRKLFLPYLLLYTNTELSSYVFRKYLQYLLHHSEFLFSVLKHFAHSSLISNRNYVIFSEKTRSITLNSIGASVRSVGYTDSADKFKNIAFSFASDSDYTGNPLYAGATLGPCAGRISGGSLSLPEKNYSLTRNEKNRHCLYSGIHSVSFINWTLVSIREEDTSAEVLFQCTLPDGCDGFPGNRTFSVSYLLNEAHELTVRYHAVSDKTTYFNISNHSYFNLSGNFEESVYDHLLQIHADSYIYNDDEFIPEGIAPVENSPFDFRKPVSLTRQMKAFPDHPQLTVSRGYNHAFLLNKNNELPQLVFASPDNAQKLFVSSDAPGNHGFPFHYTEAGKEWTRYLRYTFVI